jgi:hypothetical protein
MRSFKQVYKTKLFITTWNKNAHMFKEPKELARELLAVYNHQRKPEIKAIRLMPFSWDEAILVAFDWGHALEEGRYWHAVWERTINN